MKVYAVLTARLSYQGNDVRACVRVFQDKVRMRYKLTFTLGDQQCTETGEVDQFPPAERWGVL